MDKVSVYIHIPFCKHICAYCDFPKMLYNEEYSHKYLETLKEEILNFYEGEKVRTLYIGGGTPSILSENDRNLFKEIIKIFNLDTEYEFTYECNINDIDVNLLSFLTEIKVNRLSIGVQSFIPEKLEFLKRQTKFEETSTRINLAREYGFNNINLDLMYALPNEKLKTLKKDIALLLKLDVEHISTYSLIIEPHTMTYINEEENTAEEEELAMYEYIVKKLKKSGYNHYEISNFSKEGYESIHNLNYWYNNEFYGFGLGATGYINGVRYENTKSLEDYLNKNIKQKESLISKTEMMENELILGLRLTKGINIKEFYKKYKVNIQEVFPVNPLIRNKELIYNDGYIYLNPKYTYVLNEILLKML